MIYNKRQVKKIIQKMWETMEPSYTAAPLLIKLLKTQPSEFSGQVFYYIREITGCYRRWITQGIRELQSRSIICPTKLNTTFQGATYIKIPKSDWTEPNEIHVMLPDGRWPIHGSGSKSLRLEINSTTKTRKTTEFDYKP